MPERSQETCIIGTISSPPLQFTASPECKSHPSDPSCAMGTTCTTIHVCAEFTSTWRTSPTSRNYYLPFQSECYFLRSNNYTPTALFFISGCAICPRAAKNKELSWPHCLMDARIHMDNISLSPAWYTQEYGLGSHCIWKGSQHNCIACRWLHHDNSWLWQSPMQGLLQHRIFCKLF